MALERCNGITPKYFLKLIQSIMNCIVEPDRRLSKRDLYESIFLSDSAAHKWEDAQFTIQVLDELLRSAASLALNDRQICAAAAAKGLQNEYQEILAEFWRREHEKVHAAMFDKVRWNAQVKSSSWRMDLSVGATGAVDPAVSPKILFQMNFEDSTSFDERNQSVTFNIDKQTLSNVLNQIENIESQINSFVS